MRCVAVSSRDRRAAAPYSSTSGDADGSIMPVIMTAHIAQSSSRCDASQLGVIIHALGPVIEPYMSRAITTIHSHETVGTTTRRISTAARSARSADSRKVGGSSKASGAAPGEGRVLSIVAAASVFPGQAERANAAARGPCQRKPIGGWMSCVIQVKRFVRVRVEPFHTLCRHIDEVGGLD